MKKTMARTDPIAVKPGDGKQPAITRFAFDDAVGEVLQAHFSRDVHCARMSHKFKLYYRLRPLIPLAMRQWLQRGRNQAIEVPKGWYLQSGFMRDLWAVVKRDPHASHLHPWPNDFRIAAVLTHDVETRAGMESVDELATLEERYGLRSAWNFVPHKYTVDPGLLRDLKQRGHETGVHGYNHDGRLFESRRTFQRRAVAINRAITDFGCRGFRAPMVHRNLQWMQDLEIDYDASCFDCDPFQAMPGGVGGVWPFICGRFVELPYTLPQDHTLLVSLGETSPRIWIEKFAFLRRLAGMAMLITHPDYLDTPQRLDIYRAFLEHLVEQPNCWHALPHEVATWWRQRDQLQIVDQGDSPRLVGPAAERAKLFSLGDLLTRDTPSPVAMKT
jgi:peptidoglycan/xylan/chitin deacetylase (PgdA/CDA1 family)